MTLAITTAAIHWGHIFSIASSSGLCTLLSILNPKRASGRHLQKGSQIPKLRVVSTINSISTIRIKMDNKFRTLLSRNNNNDYVRLPGRSNSLSNSSLVCVSQQKRTSLENDAKILLNEFVVSGEDSEGNIDEPRIHEWSEDPKSVDTLFINGDFSRKESSTDFATRVESDDHLKLLSTDNEQSLQEQLSLNGILFTNTKLRNQSPELWCLVQKIDGLSAALQVKTAELLASECIFRTNIHAIPEKDTSTCAFEYWTLILSACIRNINAEPYEHRGMKIYLRKNLKNLKHALKEIFTKIQTIGKCLEKYEKEFQGMMNEMMRLKLWSERALVSVQKTKQFEPIQLPIFQRLQLQDESATATGDAEDGSAIQVALLERTSSHQLVIRQYGTHGPQFTHFTACTLYEKRNILQTIFDELQEDCSAANLKLHKMLPSGKAESSKDQHQQLDLPELEPLRMALQGLVMASGAGSHQFKRRHCVRALIMNQILEQAGKIREMVRICAVMQEAFKKMHKRVRKMYKNVSTIMKSEKSSVLCQEQAQSVTLSLKTNFSCKYYGNAASCS